MEIKRDTVIKKIENLLSGKISKEDIGWWAYDILLEEQKNFEPGYERLLEDTLRALHYFHDTDLLMHQFYPELDEILYFLKCLKGEEFYQRSKVLHWKV